MFMCRNEGQRDGEEKGHGSLWGMYFSGLLTTDSIPGVHTHWAQECLVGVADAVVEGKCRTQQ